MALRFNPLTALEGSFRGFPLLISRERKPGGQRGPLHEYPDRDVPYFEGLGRKAKQFDLSIYFVGLFGDESGATADLQADLFEAILQGGKPGPLILPGLQREQVWARSWDRERSADKAGYVSFQVTFVEAGVNQYPSSNTSWPHTLLDAAVNARTAFGAALSQGLSLVGLPLEAVGGLISSAGVLVTVLNVAAQLVGGGAPSSALASAGLLTAGFLGKLPAAPGESLDVLALSANTLALLTSWSDALGGAEPDDASRGRAIDALFTVYGEAASDSWFVASGLSPVQAAALANQTAYSAGIRRLALAEAARVAASLSFSSYDDAVALRTRFSDAFDDEINQAAAADGSREALANLQAATLLAISAAGADKARLVPYAVPRPRSAIAMAQLFYPGDADIAQRASELVGRNGVIHPAFMPASGERLSS
jgi:prophage DNA circulation protein